MELHFLILGHVSLLALCILIGAIFPIGIDIKLIDTDSLRFKWRCVTQGAFVMLFIPLEIIYWTIYFVASSF